MNDQEQAEYEDALRWRLEVLKAELDAGKIHVAEHLIDGFRASLGAIRLQADGRVDLSTVDGRIRSMALATGMMHQRQAAKDAISLQDISNIYFEFIEKQLGWIRTRASEHGVNAHEFATMVSSHEPSAKELVSGLAGFLEQLEGFWKDAMDASHFHIQDLQGSKSVFGGDLFPAHGRNIASSVGLYIDTIVLPDPFWNSRHVFRHGDDERRAYFLVKHAINLLSYRDLAVADVRNPIVVIAPQRSSIDESERNFLARVTQADALIHAKALFGREFENVEELHAFGETLSTADAVVRSVADPRRLLFDTDWHDPLEVQIAKALADWGAMMPDPSPGRLVVGQCFGRMGQATDLLLKSRHLLATPLIDAPTSWKYFNWKLEYNAALDEDEVTPLHLVRGLQHASETDATWLGNIPPAALIEMRRVGAFDEIRETISRGVSDIAVEKPQAYFRSSDKIVENIRDAFDKHKAEIADLARKKVKFAGVDIGALIAVGAVEIAAAVTGTPLFGVGAYAASQLIDAPTLRQIPERFRNLKNAHAELKKSPMGMLFRHAPKKW